MSISKKKYFLLKTIFLFGGLKIVYTFAVHYFTKTHVQIKIYSYDRDTKLIVQVWQKASVEQHHYETRGRKDIWSAW